MSLYLDAFSKRYLFKKTTVVFVLLLSFAFSIVHEFAFAIYDVNHCNINEYVQETISPHKHPEHHDICDTHFEYHHAYILPQYTVLIDNRFVASKPILYKESYKFLTNLEFIKPPIV